MLTELYIKNFKSHSCTRLPLKPLTVLTGLNGSGKSSAIQSLLLLRQSIYKKELEALILSNSLCYIGNGKDAIFQASTEDYLEFVIKTVNSEYSWKFLASENKDYLPLAPDCSPNQNVTKIPLFNKNFQYLSAGRLPEFKYERSDMAVENERQLSLKYGYGELVAQFLHFWGKEKINTKLMNANSQFDDLLSQVTAWEREISPNVNIVPKKQGDSYTINYSFSRTGSAGSTDEYKTENTAFGLTYALPVITALLSSKKDSLLLIENPEAHLHPKGQSKLAELIGLTAMTGVQIIIETHSDHFFNGIRKAIALNKIINENVSIHFFELNEINSTVSTEIKISDKGRILNHRKGLFDQFDDDLDALLGL